MSSILSFSAFARLAILVKSRFVEPGVSLSLSKTFFWIALSYAALCFVNPARVGTLSKFLIAVTLTDLTRI